MECRQKGMLQRAGKTASLTNQRVFFPGTVTDRVVRDWLSAEPEKNPNMMPHMVEEIMKREEGLIKEGGGKLIWKDRDDMRSVLQDCVEAVTKIEPALNKYVLPFNYDVDFGFKAPMKVPHPSGVPQTIILNGYMDIIVKDADGRVAVWDVKHTKDNSYWKKTRGQLSFYDLASLLLFNEPTSMVGLLQPLCKEPVKRFQLDQDDRDMLVNHVLRMTQDVFKGDFTPTEDLNQCTFCSVRHACTRWAPVRDGSKQKFSLLGS